MINGVFNLSLIHIWFKRWLKDNQAPVKKAAQDRFQWSDMLCTTKGQVNVSMPGALSIMQENVNQLDELSLIHI